MSWSDHGKLHNHSEQLCNNIQNVHTPLYVTNNLKWIFSLVLITGLILYKFIIISIYGNPFCVDKMVLKSSYSYNGTSYVDKIYLYNESSTGSDSTREFASGSISIYRHPLKVQGSPLKYKITMRISYLYNGNSHTGIMTSLYWAALWWFALNNISPQSP